MGLPDLYLTHGGANTTTINLTTNRMFNVGALTWHTKTSGLNGRGYAQGCGAHGVGGYHHLAGGNAVGGSNPMLDFHERLAKVADVWSARTALTAVRGGAGAADISGYEYIACGNSAISTWTTTLYRSLMSAGTWSTKTAAPANNGSSGAVVAYTLEQFRTLGGYTGSNHATVYQYIVSTGLWSTKGASGMTVGGGTRGYSDVDNNYGYYSVGGGGSTNQFRRFGWATDVHSALTATSANHGYGSSLRATDNLGYTTAGGSTSPWTANEQYNITGGTWSTSTAVTATYLPSTSGPDPELPPPLKITAAIMLDNAEVDPDGDPGDVKITFDFNPT